MDTCPSKATILFQDVFSTKTPPNTPVFNVGGIDRSNIDHTVKLQKFEDIQGQLDLVNGVKESFVVTVSLSAFSVTYCVLTIIYKGLFLLVGNAGEGHRAYNKAPYKGETKKREIGQVDRGMRSSLLMLDMKDDK